ncbi:MAG TPA: hypothetical protein VMB84_13585 [Stellaceae bacterium]|nr:hypothetical protein [Stellaceae bacterium]
MPVIRRGSRSQRGEGGRAVLAAFLVLLLVACVPLVSTVLPPLVDYPNHLARLHLIAEGGNQYYAVRWAPLPDLAADLVVPPLARLIPLAVAGKLFLALTFALIAGGALALNRAATGAWRLWPLLAFALVYSRILLWGFLNYLFGLGVALCGLALWLALERRPGWRLPLSLAVALACFFSHLAAFGVYALAIVGVELPPVLRLLRGGRAAAAAARAGVAALQFVGPAIILFCFAPAAPAGPLGYAPWRKADLLFSVFDNYSRPFDIACFALLIALFAGLAWRRRLAIDPRLGLAAALVFAAYLLLPSQMLTGSGADRRLPVALFALVVAATAPLPLPRRTALSIGIAAGVLFAVRMAVIEAVWLKSDAVYAGDIAALDRLPEGARLAVAYPAGDVHAGDIPLLHVATLAAARREAFVPTLFAYAGQQPIALRPPVAALAGATSPNWLWSGLVEGDAATLAASAPVLRDYDFVVFTDRRPFAVPSRPCLRALPSPADFRVFALDHAAPCG